MGQEFEYDFAECFWLNASHTIICYDFGQGCKSSEGFTGAGGSTGKVVHTHMAGKLELVVCRRLHLLPREAYFKGCLSSQHEFPMRDQKRAKRKSNVFYVLILEFMLHDFHNILLVILVCSIQCWRGLHKGMNTRSHGGPCWRLVTKH